MNKALDDGLLPSSVCSTALHCRRCILKGLRSTLVGLICGRSGAASTSNAQEEKPRCCRPAAKCCFCRRSPVAALSQQLPCLRLHRGVSTGACATSSPLFHLLQVLPWPSAGPRGCQILLRGWGLSIAAGASWSCRLLSELRRPQLLLAFKKKQLRQPPKPL